MAASTRMTTQMGPQEKAFLEDGAIHDELGLSQRNKAHDGGDRQDDDAQQGRKPPMAPEMMSAMILTTTVQSPSAFLTGDHEQDNADDRGMRNRAFRLPPALGGVVFHFLLSP